MATRTFIKFDGIDGESTNKDHKDEVDVLSWSWGLTVPASTGGAGGGVGRPVPKDLRLIHPYDKASPLLARAAVTGRHLKTAVLSARKSGGNQPDFFKVTLKDVTITSVMAGDDGNGATEEVTLAYGEIDFSYKPQDSAGRLGAEVIFNWNLQTGPVP